MFARKCFFPSAFLWGSGPAVDSGLARPGPRLGGQNGFHERLGYASTTTTTTITAATTTTTTTASTTTTTTTTSARPKAVRGCPVACSFVRHWTTQLRRASMNNSQVLKGLSSGVHFCTSLDNPHHVRVPGVLVPNVLAARSDTCAQLRLLGGWLLNRHIITSFGVYQFKLSFGRLRS